jgi:hypothetical protein
MYELSIIQGAESFQIATAKDPCNCVENDGVPDSIKVATPKDSSNEEVENSNNSGPIKCDIMPSLYNNKGALFKCVYMQWQTRAR